jgi:hypothetical protein
LHAGGLWGAGCFKKGEFFEQRAAILNVAVVNVWI